LVDRLDTYTGKELFEVDRKNRLSIPYSFRQTLQNRCPGGLFTIGAGTGKLPCLAAYDDIGIDELKTKLKTLQANELPNRALVDQASEFFGTSEKYNLDVDGRIILLPKARDFGGIDRHVLFIANGEGFELWNPWTYLTRDDISDTLRRMAQSELRSRGLSLDGPPT
jgi:MraZ protein